jgi:C-terminal processing protease CtpA/Prc
MRKSASGASPPSSLPLEEKRGIGPRAGDAAPPASAARQASHGTAGDVCATFVEAGPLGVVLSPSGVYTGHTEILALNAGTQATQHSQLSAGLLLQAVGNTPVAGLAYDEVISLIGSTTSRPLTLRFQSEPEELAITFTEAGSLGLDLAQSERSGGAVEVLAVHAGSQATQHAELRPGLLVTAVGESAVPSASYEDTCRLISSHPERPLTLRFATSHSRLLEARLAESSALLCASRAEADR